MRRICLAVCLLLLAACAGAGGAEDAAAGAGAGGADAPPTEALRGELTVFAAASLTDVLETLAARLEGAHPDLDVLVNLAGSQQLAGQLVEGAPADVFAAASGGPMDRVAEAGLLADAAEIFATNRLAIAVEPGNPLGLGGLEDLAREDLVLVLAAPEVPAGQYAAEALDAADVAVAPDSLEVDVRAVLSKVALGEADAGIVYRTDIASAGGRVDAVEIPEERNVVARYPVAVLADATNPDAARAFLALLRSPEGRAALAEAGFGAP